LFALAYHGNGGWTWSIAYDLPIHIRRYCLKMLQDTKEAEQKANQPKEKENNVTPPKIPKAVQQGLSKTTERRKSPKS
jgi:hypothetical protein